MLPFFVRAVSCRGVFFGSLYSLGLEILALRQQLGVLKKKNNEPLHRTVTVAALPGEEGLEVGGNHAVERVCFGISRTVRNCRLPDDRAGTPRWVSGRCATFLGEIRQLLMGHLRYGTHP